MKMQVNGEKIKQLREQRCWSQQQLAEMSGISARTLQRLEAKSVASQETIKSLAAVFEIDCDKLLPEDETTTVQPVLAQKENEELSISINGAHQIESDDDDTKRHQARKKLYINLTLLIASITFGFYGIFNAYSEQRLDIETYQLLKNSLSIVLLVTVSIVIVQAYRKGVIGKENTF